jgi:hypothetical protein
MHSCVVWPGPTNSTSRVITSRTRVAPEVRPSSAILRA